MTNKKLLPDFIFETSWEVCNKVGGIYTVLSTRAKTLQKKYKDKIVFIGPDLREDNPLFETNNDIYPDWTENFEKATGMKARTGRWNIPGRPIVILVDFHPLMADKNNIYARAWEFAGVDSLHAYGDYDESCTFAVAAAMAAESLIDHLNLNDEKVIYHAHEWMTGMGLIHMADKKPSTATIFTTHATTTGRSIACNDKPLYDYMDGYFGDQMASELHVEAKHSVEKQAARIADCFTTVSDLTGRECEQLLDKKPEVILKNGFENDFVPRPKDYKKLRHEARAKLLATASEAMHCDFPEDTMIIGTSGRYEFRNKGIDMYIDAIDRLRHDERLERPVLALITTPAWSGEPELSPRSTHKLIEPHNDKVMQMMDSRGDWNKEEDKVKLLFIPKYLDGDDGILNIPYYDFMTALDLTIYPSYYEPWGYTPLESIAFHIPTITTNLSGFGLWAEAELGHKASIEDGVKVVRRTDSNFDEASGEVEETILKYTAMKPSGIRRARKAAHHLADKALWTNFVKDYYKAYDIALKKKQNKKSTL